MAVTVKYKDAKKESVEMIYCGDAFYDDVEDLFEAFYEELSAVPRVVYGTSQAVLGISAESILEDAYECSDIPPELVTIDMISSFQEYINKWLESNPTNYYQPDYSYRIDISEEVKEWEQSLHSSE